MNFKFVNIHEYLDQMHPFESGRNYTMPGRAAYNPDEEDMKKIEALTDEIMNGAEECTMTREDVLKSTIAYYVTKKLMDAYDCNGFCAVCPDACATRRLNEERITYCMTHSINNGCGLPSACEYDAPAVVSKAILQALGLTGSLRFSPAFYNTEQEIETAVAALERAIGILNANL